MKNKRDDEIRESINVCKMKLHTIMPHLSDEKPALNETFNRLLIEKAVLRDKLMKKSCDYFKS